MAKSKIAGINALNRKFRDMPKRQRQYMTDALEINARELVAMQKRQVRRRSGTVARSINYAWRSPLHVLVMAGSRKAFYAKPLEFGRKPKVQRSRRSGSSYEHPGVRPHPFFFPSYRALRRRLKGRFYRAQRKAIQEIARNGG